MSKVFTTEARLLIVKKEAEAGTTEDLAGVDATLKTRTLELTSFITEFDVDDSSFQTGDHTGDEAIPTVKRAAIGFGVKIAPSEVHYDNSSTDTITQVIDPLTPVLEAAGLKSTAVIPTDELTQDGYIEYVPTIEADVDTITLGLYDFESATDGVAVEYKVGGAMGTLKIGFEKTGSPFLAAFGFEGKAVSALDVAKAAAPVFDDVNALGSLAFNSLNTDILVEEVNQDGTDAGNTPVNFCANTANLDTGIGLADIMCQIGNEGLKHKYVATRKPMFDVDPLLTSLADFNFWEGTTTAKMYKIILSHQVSASDPVFTITIPRAQLMEPSDNDDGGLRRKGYNFRPLRNKAAVTGTVENDYIIRIGSSNVIAV